MTYMKQLERLLFLINALKAKPCTTHELFAQLSEQNSNSSIRQLQRDFKDIALLLSNNETLKSYRKDKLKYFFIEISESDFTSANENKIYKNTNFYVQSKSKQIDFNLNAIENAIKESKSIVISEIKNEETGDNNNFETKNIFLRENYSYVLLVLAVPGLVASYSRRDACTPNNNKIASFRKIAKNHPLTFSFKVL